MVCTIGRPVRPTNNSQPALRSTESTNQSIDVVKKPLAKSQLPKKAIVKPACLPEVGPIPSSPIKSVNLAIKEDALMQEWPLPQKPSFNTGKRIAIIGSGPSGLAAAVQLVNAGHNVCIYEKKEQCGGSMRNGDSMQNSLLDCRLSDLEREGVRFLTNIEIGKDVPASFIVKDNDALIICIGSPTPIDIMIEGRFAEGIGFAMDFLQSFQSFRPEIDIFPKKRAIILGGGDVSIDCITECKRLGCQNITAFEISPQPSESVKPELLFKPFYGYEESKVLTGSDLRKYSIAINRFLHEKNSNGVNKFTGLEVIDVEWEKDKNGAWKLIERVNTLRVIEADICIIATGFVEPTNTVVKQLGLMIDPRSNILTSKDQYSTTVAKVFVAGGCRRGRTSNFWDIQEGRRAACQVDKYLKGEHIPAGQDKF